MIEFRSFLFKKEKQKTRGEKEKNSKWLNGGERGKSL